MKKCWCGETHPKGCLLNGEVRHFVLNWKLYQLRHKDSEEEERKQPAPDLEPVAL